MQKKRLGWRDTVNLKFHDVTTWLTITIHILLNISRIRDNNTMKFGQLVRYNGNIFLQISHRK